MDGICWSGLSLTKQVFTHVDQVGALQIHLADDQCWKRIVRTTAFRLLPSFCCLERTSHRTTLECDSSCSGTYNPNVSLSSSSVLPARKCWCDKDFLAWVTIETTAVSHVSYSLFLLLNPSLFLYLLFAMWNLEGDVISWGNNSLNQRRKLKRRAEYVRKTTKFEIWTSNIHHLGNFILAEKVVVRFLTSRVSSNIVRWVSENTIFNFFCLRNLLHSLYVPKFVPYQNNPCL